MTTKGIVYCDECGQASGYYGDWSPTIKLEHADDCMYLVEDYATWGETEPCENGHYDCATELGGRCSNDPTTPQNDD